MENLASILTAYLIAQGSHTGGHFDEASKQGIPINLHAKELMEVWNQPDFKKNVDMDGSGFRMQDVVNNPSASRELSLANALIKASYLSGLPKVFGGEFEGDINRMERQSGNKNVGNLIAASMLSDMLKYYNPKQNWNVGFDTFGTGQPGLRFNYRW